MYNLYEQICKNDYDNIIPKKKELYEHIFRTKFNIAFFKPKQDQCEIYVAFQASKDSKTLCNDD